MNLSEPPQRIRYRTTAWIKQEATHKEWRDLKAALLKRAHDSAKRDGCTLTGKPVWEHQHDLSMVAFLVALSIEGVQNHNP